MEQVVDHSGKAAVGIVVQTVTSEPIDSVPPRAALDIPESLQFLELSVLSDLIGRALLVVEVGAAQATFIAVGCRSREELSTWLTPQAKGTLIPLTNSDRSLGFVELFPENPLPPDQTLMAGLQRVLHGLVDPPAKQAPEFPWDSTGLDPARALTDLSPIGLAVFDENLRYTYVNGALARLNSKSIDEHLGKRFYEVVPWLWPSVAPIFEWIRRTKQAFLHQELYTDGRSSYADSPSHLASYYPVLSAHSQVIGFCVLVAPCRDLFHQRRLAQTVSFRERLPTDPVDELGRFFCHELKEPLRNLKSILQMFGSGEESPCGMSRDQLLEYSARSVNRLVDFVQELSIYTGSGAERSAYTFEDTAKVAEEAVLNVTACMGQPLPRFTLGELPRLWCCRFELQRVFENLILNAAKAGRDLQLNILVTSKQDEWMHTFSVEDDGHGIDPEILPYLFHPLSEDMRRKRGRVESEGWGLGLAICRKIIERHGGRIWADSTVKQGSRIAFTLPKVSPSKQSYSDPTWFFVPRPEPTEAM